MNWDRIFELTKKPSISNFPRKIDFSELAIRKEGKPTLEQILEVLDSIDSLNDITAIILPKKFFYDLDSRTIEKNVRKIKLRRIKTKREAIEQQLTPKKLIREKIERMRDRYNSNPKTLLEDYAFINFRGITDRTSKNYLISDAIRGFLYAERIAKENLNLIEIKRYDTLEMLLRKLSEEERSKIREELLKIRKRKMMTPLRARRIILKKQSERIVTKVPSTTERKFYKNIKFRKIPQKFPFDSSELNKEFYATWADFKIEPSCNCGEKTFFISYLGAGETWYCVHEIMAFIYAIFTDWNLETKKPKTGYNPYIATSPFFKPTKEVISLYKKLKDQIFIKKENHYAHLPKIFIDIILEKQIRRKVELID